MVECPSCNGTCCEDCHGKGHFEITGCPSVEFVDTDLVMAIRYADLFRNGLPPVSGGVSDQSNWFVEFAQAWWSEVWRASSEANASE